MAAPFGFSIGDFIAGINLLITSINAVKDSTGSSSEYRAITATLRQVSTTLESLNGLQIDEEAHRHAFQVSATRCGETIFQFINAISKYKASLERQEQPKSTVLKWKFALRKIEWSLYSKDDVRRFQAQLQGDLLALQTTIQTVHLSIAASNFRATQSALIRMESKIDQAAAFRALVTQALSKCFEEFRGLLLMVFFSNMRFITYILSGSSVSTAVQEERPIYLHDPHNRVIPFPRAWITDWEDFESILKIQFKRVPGLRKIAAREYMLRDALRSTELTQSTPIEEVFCPGRKINMSIVFNVPNASALQSLCPKCFKSVNENHDNEAKCPHCGVLFSRRRIGMAESVPSVQESSANLPNWRYQDWPLTRFEERFERNTPESGSSSSKTEQSGSVHPCATFDCIEDFSRITLVHSARRKRLVPQNREDSDAEGRALKATLSSTIKGNKIIKSDMVGEDPVLQRLSNLDPHDGWHVDKITLRKLLAEDEDHGQVDAVRRISKNVYISTRQNALEGMAQMGLAFEKSGDLAVLKDLYAAHNAHLDRIGFGRINNQLRKIFVLNDWRSHNEGSNIWKLQQERNEFINIVRELQNAF